MKFKTVAEAFNYYRNKEKSELESRAKAINNDIDNNPSADIEAYNIELRAIKEVKENMELRENNNSNVNIITGRDFKNEEVKEFRKDDDVVATKEYRNAFYKTLLGKSLTDNEKRAFNAVVEERADVFDASTDVAAAIPTNTLNEVIKKARTIGGLMAEARAFAIPSKISIPVGTPATKGEWHKEGALVTPEKVALEGVSFDGYEIIKIFSLSAKAKRMTIDAFEAYLVDELTACVMETIEDALVNGTGVDQGTGLEKGVTWKKDANMVEATDIAYKDVVKAIGLLKRGYSMGAKWAMNNATLYNVFYGMVDGNKRPIFINDPKGESIGKILGFDVIVDDNIADNTAYLGNYSKYLGYNLAQGIAIEVSRDSSFRSGLIDYRALAIADTKPLVNEAFIKLTKSAL